MRITILTKLILVLFVLTVMPIVILGYLSSKDAKNLALQITEESQQIGKNAIFKSTKALEDLGAESIKNQAIAVKKLVEQYIRNHPDKTGEDLINDPEFQEIAIQPVGKTGYSTLVQTKTQTIIAHPNKALMGRSMMGVIEKPEWQDWWRVVKKTYDDNVDSYGYYQWEEEDGTFRKKYQYLAVIDEKLEGTIDLSVAATTYIDEFLEPVVAIEESLQEYNDQALNVIKTKTETFSIKNVILTITLLTLLVVLIVGVIFARSLTNPIKALTKVGNELSNGNINIEIPEIKTRDEIKDLSDSFKSALAAIKFLMESSDNKKNK